MVHESITSSVQSDNLQNFPTSKIGANDIYIDDNMKEYKESIKTALPFFIVFPALIPGVIYLLFFA